ncbi:MAG TPA: two-component regulator propeller domain-containing protein [Bacteroidota bacterium]|nr:two-component regulator propeller domain-containing protein [Bacteroidota bacterium]
MSGAFSPRPYRLRADRHGKKFHCLRCWLLALCFASPGVFPLLAQVYPIRSYGVSDGLAHSGVTSIYQDPSGYYWIGTIAGLSYYDGAGFRNYLDQADERSFVTSILQIEDSVPAQAGIWVATEGNGVAHLSRHGELHGWMRVSGGVLPSDSVYSLVRDRQRNVWIGTANGILVLHPDGTFRTLTTSDGLQDKRIRDISQRGDGTLWVASVGGVVRFRYSPNGLTDRRVVVRHGSLALCPAADGGMLIGTNAGPTGREGVVLKVQRDDQIDTLLNTRKAGGPLKVMSLLEDRGGAVWIGAAPGLFLIDCGKLSYIGEKNGLQSGEVNSLMEDAAGNLWLGGSGLMKLPQKSFRHFPLADMFAGHILRFGLLASDRSVWFGGFGRLVRKRPDGMFVEIPPQSGTPLWNVQGIAEDRWGTIWITTLGGLMEHKNETMRHADIEGYRRRMAIEKIHIDRSGDIWIGSDAVLYQIRANRVIRRYGRENGIPHDTFLSITSAPDGSIWFGMDASGAGRLFDGRVTMFTNADGLPSDAVNQVYFDKDSLLWFATRKGLATFDRGSIRLMTDLNNLMGGSPITREIIQDSRDRYWISTRGGLYEWDGVHIYHYDSRDGLPSDLMHCSFFDYEGNLWAGSSRGPALLDGRALTANVPTPTVHISSLNEKENHASISLPASYPYDQNSISLGFHATGFVDERSMEFEWRMGGVDEIWYSDKGPRTIRFPLIPPGDYRFQVRARNRNGEWSSMSEYAFVVESPFWQRWWFYAAISFLVLLILWTIHRYHIRHLLEVERLRVRIAGDLHDEIGSYLGGIALESQMMQRKAPVGDDVKARLAKITTMAHRTAEAMRDMVWLIDPEHDTLKTLLVKMKDVAFQLAGPAHLAFRGPKEPSDEPLDLEFKRHVFLIYKEALYNASRHAQATAIDITVDRTDGQLSFSIKDNGKGFDAAKVQYGNGIRNIRDRAAKIGATVRIEARPEMGTSVTLVAPL